MQIDTEVAEKYAKRYPSNNNQRYTRQVRIRRICRRMRVSINGHGDLEL